MKQHPVLRLYRFLQRYWNALAAVISLIGYLVCQFVPVLQKHTTLFVLLGANAIIWTMIEIKLSTTAERKPQYYADMRLARSEIIREIRATFSSQRAKSLTITIIGGRIRAISEMIREIKNDITSETVNAKNVIFDVYCMHPEFIRSWAATQPSNLELKKRSDLHADLVTKLTVELLSFNTLTAFSRNNVTIKIHHYKTLPVIYAFLIGTSSLFWGAFTWERESGDFVGPENPCYYLTGTSNQFAFWHAWVLNRAELLDTISEEIGESPAARQ
jgi:hypothetical protein